MKLHGQNCCPSHKYQLGAFGQIHSHSSRNPMFGYLMGLSEVTQEDDVTAHLATAHQQTLAIPGPVEVENAAGIESGQLARWVSVQGLLPNVGSFFFSQHVLQALAVRRPEQRAPGVRPSRCSDDPGLRRRRYLRTRFPADSV